MKRWTLRIVLCLLLGVVTTVAVAWGLAVVVRPFASRYAGASASVGGEIFDVERHEARLATLFVYARYRGSTRHSNELDSVHRLLPSWYRPQDTDDFITGRSQLDLRVLELRGVPFRSLYSQRIRSTVGGTEKDTILGGLATSLPQWDHAGLKHPRILPLRPILSGFIINTFFYAAIWFGLFFGLGATRKAIRRKRGRCVKCGYDLRGARLPSRAGRGAGGEGESEAGCPECGWGRDPKECMS